MLPIFSNKQQTDLKKQKQILKYGLNKNELSNRQIIEI